MVDAPVFDKMLFGAEPDAECQDDECLKLLRQKTSTLLRKEKDCQNANITDDQSIMRKVDHNIR